MTEVHIDYGYKESSETYFNNSEEKQNLIIFENENNNYFQTTNSSSSNMISNYDTSDNDDSLVNGKLENNKFEDTESIGDNWVLSCEKLSWASSKIASYNVTQKLFRCIECACVGLLENIAEHWLGTHANVKIYQCLKCPYSSAWMKCLRMHLARQHQHNICTDINAENLLGGEEFWQKDPSLEQVIKYLDKLKTELEISKTENVKLYNDELQYDDEEYDDEEEEEEYNDLNLVDPLPTSADVLPQQQLSCDLSTLPQCNLSSDDDAGGYSGDLPQTLPPYTLPQQNQPSSEDDVNYNTLPQGHLSSDDDVNYVSPQDYPSSDVLIPSDSNYALPQQISDADYILPEDGQSTTILYDRLIEKNATNNSKYQTVNDDDIGCSKYTIKMEYDAHVTMDYNTTDIGYTTDDLKENSSINEQFIDHELVRYPICNDVSLGMQAINDSEKSQLQYSPLHYNDQTLVENQSQYYPEDENLDNKYETDNLATNFSIQNYSITNFNTDYSLTSGGANDLSISFPANDLTNEFPTEPEIIPISKRFTTGRNDNNSSFTISSSCVDELSCSDLFPSDVSVISEQTNQTIPMEIVHETSKTEFSTTSMLKKVNEQINQDFNISDEDQNSDYSPNDTIDKIIVSQLSLTADMDIIKEGRTSPQINIDSVIIKRYNCEQCPYSTDRKDLFNRHENIHKMDKRYECNICHKQFNRADHIKKHFLRLHTDFQYDLNNVKRNIPGGRGMRAPRDSNKHTHTRVRSVPNKILPVMKNQPNLQINRQEKSNSLQKLQLQQQSPTASSTQNTSTIRLLLQSPPQLANSINATPSIRVSVVQTTPKTIPSLKQMTLHIPQQSVMTVASPTPPLPQISTIIQHTSAITNTNNLLDDLTTQESPKIQIVSTQTSHQPSQLLTSPILGNSQPVDQKKNIGNLLIQKTEPSDSAVSITAPRNNQTSVIQSIEQVKLQQLSRPMTVIVEPKVKNNHDDMFVQKKTRKRREKPIDSTIIKQPRSPIANKTYDCELCEWVGVDKWSLRRHMNTHSRPYECPLCEYKAARSERLQTHVHNVHKMHICTACNFVVHDIMELINHQQENHKNMRTKRNRLLKKMNAATETSTSTDN